MRKEKEDKGIAKAGSDPSPLCNIEKEKIQQIEKMQIRTGMIVVALNGFKRLPNLPQPVVVQFFG